MNDEKCSRDTAKTYVIAIINGAKYSSRTLITLANELKPAIKWKSVEGFKVALKPHKIVRTIPSLMLS